MSIAEKMITIAENEQKVFDAGNNAFFNMFTNYGARPLESYSASYGSFTQ